jgi:predicted PurR-regulated permease PerM
MPKAPYSGDSALLRRALFGLSLGALALTCLLILRPVLSPVLWAGILAYASWPLYRRLHALLRAFNTSAALIMTLLMTCAVMAPVTWLLMLLEAELGDAYGALAAFLAHGPHLLPQAIRDIPGLGSLLQENVDRYTNDPNALGREMMEGLRQSLTRLTGLLGGIGRNVLKFLLTLLTLFFFYRDGDSVVRQCHRVIQRFFGERVSPYIRAAGAITRAVLYGLLITAFAQGLMAGIGYRLVGLPNPALLGALTGVLSVVPTVGTAIVFVPLSAWLILTGPLWEGPALLLWGFLLVHPIDNILRPWLISGAARLPLLVVMFGAIGGLAAFGLIGLFAGPVLLGVAMVIWREWAAQYNDSSANEPTRSPEGGMPSQRVGWRP